MSGFWRLLSAAGFVLLGTACGKVSGTAEQTQPRGKYLVESVAMCADCHTPRNQAGALELTRWLQGSVLDFHPAHDVPSWADKAPGIAGLPKLGDAAVIRLLETGQMPDGQPARAPMPQYRLSHADAVAVTDYLKSLPSASR